MTSCTCPYTDAQLRRFLLVEIAVDATGWSEEEMLECIEPDVPHWRRYFITLGAAPTDEAVLAYFTALVFTLPPVFGQTVANSLDWARDEAELTASRIRALRQYFSVTT
jgi:hypothetical protein